MARLATPFGHRLAAAATLLIACASFWLVAANVATRGVLDTLDFEVAQWLHQQATPTLTTALLVVTTLDSTFAVSAYASAFALFSAWRGRWRRAALWVVGVGGVLLLNDLLKHAFRRARPVFDDPLLTLHTYSFPSGHVAGSTVFYGLLASLVFARTRHAVPRSGALLGALAMVVLVAFTRIALGVHYLSDALAAFCEGAAWLALLSLAFATKGDVHPSWKSARDVSPAP